MSKGIPLSLVILPSIFIGGLAVWMMSKYLSKSRRKIKVRNKNKRIIHIITSAEDWESHYPQLREQTGKAKVVGLDCEWVLKNGCRHPVALLQLATQQGLCLLVQLCKMSHDIPRSLKTFLFDPSILKVGVAVKDDGIKLFKDYGLTVKGCLELRLLLSRVGNVYTCPNSGLQGLAEGILGVRLNKDITVRCGNWEAEHLTESQISYAAADALVGVDIFTRLVLTKVLGGVPNQTDEGSVCEEHFWRTAHSLCQGIVDCVYQFPRRLPEFTLMDSSNKMLELRKLEKMENVRAFSPRQRPLSKYKCQMLSPSGQYFCTCDTLKAEWYLEKNLGTKMSSNPLTVKLKFEPARGSLSETECEQDDGEIQDNVCVVCGATDSYIRKFLVPREYRKFFPRLMKSVRYHNILLLCLPCYQVSSRCDAVLRRQLAVKCDAPLDSGVCAKTVNNHDLQKVRAAAKALKLNKVNSTIPALRVKELEALVLDHYGVVSLTEELLDAALNIDIRENNRHYVPHGKKVVDYHKVHGGLIDFEKFWRQYFIDTMKPQYLPPLWSVDYRNVNVDS